ncbi:MAG: hypothetical protein IJG52_02015 [Lachnospiraceae bacterium]|nr:hypothetical protein [Lachnospiraceae bacterium]
MKWWGLEPVTEGADTKEAAAQLKSAVTIERFKISDGYLYVPGKGFSWRFLPLAEVRGVIPGITVDAEDNALVSFSVEKPILRVIYQGGMEPLSFEHGKNAEMVTDLLKKHIEENRNHPEKQARGRDAQEL